MAKEGRGRFSEWKEGEGGSLLANLNVNLDFRDKTRKNNREDIRKREREGESYKVLKTSHFHITCTSFCGPSDCFNLVFM